MKNRYCIWLLVIICGSPLFSCQEDVAVSGEDIRTETYEKTIMDFLQDDAAGQGLTFDSLLYLIDHFPDSLNLRDSLSRADASYTLFAIPDQCFQIAFQNLNKFRSDYEIGEALSLQDLIIEPFTVTDTTITYMGIVDDVEQYDTIYTYRHYDYRAQLDSVVCRYLFSQAVTSDDIGDAGGTLDLASFHVGYSMSMEGGHHAASGALDLGNRYLELIDEKNSKLSDNWVTAGTSRFDIKAQNGYIHILLPSHEFGFNDMIRLFQNYGNERKTKK